LHKCFKKFSLTDSQIRKAANDTLKIEAESLLQVQKLLNKDFIRAVRLICSSKGRVVVTGIGKSGIIATKIVATLNSTGTPSLFMHAADAIHGDLGMIQKEDIIICISKSGESPEIKLLIPILKNAGNILIAIVGNMNSFLAQQSDLVVDTTVSKEACPNNLAPTSSTTVQMAIGDALAVCLLKMRGFTGKDFAKFHPGGLLGKQLYLRVSDLAANHEKPFVQEDASVKKIIIEMTSKRLGATVVLNKKNQLTGIITDGDLRRMMEKFSDTSHLSAKEIMSKNPRTIQQEELAVNALNLMRASKITQLIVMNKKQYAGMVHVHDLLREGLV
jgi:arabinose-5-phosphate isomerase